jgi:hypothetical protein
MWLVFSGLTSREFCFVYRLTFSSPPSLEGMDFVTVAGFEGRFVTTGGSEQFVLPAFLSSALRKKAKSHREVAQRANRPQQLCIPLYQQLSRKKSKTE